MSDKLLENIETLEGHLSGKAGEVDRQVELLAIAIRDAYSGGAECSTEADMRRARKDARTVLAELAKMGAKALPSGWLLPHGDAPGAAHVILDYVKPVLAVKDAELARQAEEIGRLRAEATPTDEQLAEEAACFAYGSDWWDGATDKQRGRVANAALHIIRGGDGRGVFGAEVKIYAEGARRAGRRAAGAKGSA